MRPRRAIRSAFPVDSEALSSRRSHPRAGTRDLGQEVYIALAKADVGRGIVAGLGVAMIAMIADRMMTASSVRMKRRLGLA